jgi:hypothetical protein
VCGAWCATPVRVRPREPSLPEAMGDASDCTFLNAKKNGRLIEGRHYFEVPQEEWSNWPGATNFVGPAQGGHGHKGSLILLTERGYLALTTRRFSSSPNPAHGSTIFVEPVQVSHPGDAHRVVDYLVRPKAVFTAFRIMASEEPALTAWRTASPSLATVCDMPHALGLSKIMSSTLRPCEFTSCSTM